MDKSQPESHPQSVQGDEEEEDASSFEGPMEVDELPDPSRKEDAVISYLRIFVGLLLCGVAFGICISSYLIARKSEERDFREDFTDIAEKLVESFESTLQQRFRIFENVGTILTSYAVSIQSTNETADGFPRRWPFITVPNILRLLEQATEMATVMSIGVLPVIQEEDREQWETYAVENQGWLRESIAKRENVSLNDLDFAGIPTQIMKLTPSGFQRETGSGPFVVPWTSFPGVRTLVANANLYNHPSYAKSLRLLLRYQKPAFPPSYDFWDPEKRESDPRRPMILDWVESFNRYGTEYQEDPVLPLLYPVFDELDDGQERNIVAAIVFGVYWRAYLVQLLPSSVTGVIAVLENTCGQVYTYQIDGSSSRFLGHGDLHREKFTYLEVGSDLTSVLQKSASDEAGSMMDLPEELEGGNCVYSLRVYPSDEFESKYLTIRPLVYALTLAALFSFTCAIFFLYDFLVERRQKVVLKSAQQSGALVQSLFPADVRDRLYEEQEKVKAEKDQRASENWKLQQSYSSVTSRASVSSAAKVSRAIADLYPDCSVLFADLVGFTKWSSDRTPTDVFDLLETIYGSFDQTAKKRQVFKIETIGDCYVAATGLPGEPQPDHALIMVKFANECMHKLFELIHDEALIDRLGEECTDLAMRVGIHSGPVTAGVLRGDRSRFQVFGDTVNTAARMESNGAPGKIQVSEVTADLLRNSGKAGWLTARPDLVEAKGKGTMQTYWVTVIAGDTKSGYTGITAMSDMGATDLQSHEDEAEVSVVPDTAAYPVVGQQARSKLRIIEATVRERANSSDS